MTVGLEVLQSAVEVGTKSPQNVRKYGGPLYSIMTKGCIVALVLPLRCFLFLLPNYTNILVCFFLFAIFGDKPEVFLPRYSQTAILHAAHFQRVVKYYMLLLGFVNNMVSVLSPKTLACVHQQETRNVWAFGPIQLKCS